MRRITELNFDVQRIYDLIINTSTGKPFTKPSTTWSIPVYYIWRMLRFHLGIDPRIPIYTSSSIYGHPQEKETNHTLSLMKSKMRK